MTHWGKYYNFYTWEKSICLTFSMAIRVTYLAQFGNRSEEGLINLYKSFINRKAASERDENTFVALLNNNVKEAGLYFVHSAESFDVHQRIHLLL